MVSTKRVVLPLAAILLGVAVLLGLWWHNHRLDLRPVYLPLDFSAENTQQSEFVAPHTDMYDVEVELRKPAGRPVIKKLITAIDTESDLKLNWTVGEQSTTTAQGEGRGYLYYTAELFRMRLIKQLLGLENYEQIRVTRYARGVGRFRAESGRRYTVTTQTQPLSIGDVSAGKPHLVIRLDRRTAGHIFHRSVAIAIVAALLIVAGIIYSIIAALRFWLSRE